MYSVSVDSFEAWRKAAREYLAAAISPNEIQWLGSRQGGLFDSNMLDKQEDVDFKITAPRIFISQLRQASCYLAKENTESKWALFYSLLWRVVYEDRNTLLLKSDPEVSRLDHMVKAVNRDMHKMKAFVRFKTESGISNEFEGDGCCEHYSAWFEPEHAIVEATAPFFAKRFAGMAWSILTPHGCAHWNQKRLLLSSGISRPELQQDEFDEFWRVYYRNIFNPARLKEQAMMSEMPKKYWQYLPEAQCIRELTYSAESSLETMLNSQLTDSDRVRITSKVVTSFQDRLRVNNRS